MILFFDLDGPILDVSPRYVALHHQLLIEQGVTGMEAARYWARKRARRSEEEILAELGLPAASGDYVRRRLALIETAPYLAHDRCWPWALECLSDLARQAQLVMVTARSDRSALLRQLDDLGIQPFFREILSEPGGSRVDLQKAALITDYLRRHPVAPDGHWMIGDTEADIHAGKHAGLRTIAVLSGIRDQSHLQIANPDFLVPDIRSLAAILDLPVEKPASNATSS